VKGNTMISISHNGITELTSCIEELETLTSKPSMNSRDEKRHAFLLSKVSLLKSGISVAELRRYEMDRLLAQAGLARAPQAARTRLDEEASREWRSFLKGEPVRPTRVPPDTEVRANEAGTQSLTATQGPAGGYFVPFGIHDRAFETMRQHDQVFDPQFSSIVETSSGNATTFPSWNDVTNSSVQIGETVQSNEVDIANFGNITLNAYTFRSKIVAVSIELLQDSEFDFGAILERVFAMRHARGVGAALISGSGVNSPTGLVTAVVASGASPVIAAGSSTNTGGSETGSTTIGTQDINNLYAKLDPAYRNGACW
jgi:HK97 family phage major capsid protein